MSARFLFVTLQLVSPPTVNSHWSRLLYITHQRFWLAVVALSSIFTNLVRTRCYLTPKKLLQCKFVSSLLFQEENYKKNKKVQMTNVVVAVVKSLAKGFISEMAFLTSFFASILSAGLKVTRQNHLQSQKHQFCLVVKAKNKPFFCHI